MELTKVVTELVGQCFGLRSRCPIRGHKRKFIERDQKIVGVVAVSTQAVDLQLSPDPVVIDEAALLAVEVLSLER